MGAFKIQTDLDLSGFNLLNFCIQSYTDLENVPNLGLGRKLFFTGNSTDEKNLREVIWDGVEWKAAAYLDDIEAITNGEGSLGTRVKTLEDMLNVDDANDVINTWAEIQAFLDQVQEGTDLMDLLNSKLDKTGGTITSEAIAPLMLSSTSSSGHSLLQFSSGTTYYGALGFMAENTPYFRTTNGGFNTLIHSGNALDQLKGTFLPLTGGTIITGSFTLADGVNILNSTKYGFIVFDGTNNMFGAVNSPMILRTNDSSIVHQRGSSNYYILDSGNFKSLIGDTYLKTTGGTMKGTGNYAQEVLSIDTDNVYYTIFAVKNQGESKGWLEWTPDTDTGKSVTGFGLYNATTGERLHLSDNGGVFFGINPLLHSGNVGEYAVKYDNGASIDNARHSIGYDNGNRGSENFPIAVGGGGYISFGHDSYGGQFLGSSNGLALYYRGVENNAFSAWKTIAFTDSTVEAAKKLVTSAGADALLAETNALTIPNAWQIRSVNGAGNGYVTMLLVNSANDIVYGYGGNKAYHRASSYDFTVGTASTTAMTITEEGNVLVGASYMPVTLPAPKMSVHGGLLCVQAKGGTFSLNSLPERGLVLGGDAHTLSQYLESSGNFAIQAHNTSDGTTRALNLNPLGGAVNVGSGGLNVAGALDAKSRVLIGGATDDENYKLNVLGSVLVGNGIYSFIIKSNGSILSTIPTTTTGQWARSLGFNCGDETLAAYGAFGVGGSLRYMYIGKDYLNPSVAIHASGYVGIGGITDPQYKLDVSGDGRFTGLITASGGALIPTGQKMTFGADGPTMEYDADANAIKVTGNIYATGTVASGGKAVVGEGDTGGGGNANVYSDVLEGVITQEWEVGNPFQKEDVIVSLYIWNTDESRWKMFLADIGVTSENIWVTFGRPTSTSDKFMAVVMG